MTQSAKTRVVSFETTMRLDRAACTRIAHLIACKLPRPQSHDLGLKVLE
jgi:hypothetical protein